MITTNKARAWVMLVYSKVGRRVTFSISFRDNYIIYLSFVWEKCFASQRIDMSFHETHQHITNVFHVHTLTFLCNFVIGMNTIVLNEIVYILVPP